MKFNGVVSCSNEDYHAEKEHLSSSNYKTLLKDPEKFYREKILGKRREVPQSTQNAFDEGTLAHTLILEPDMLQKDFEFFSGFRKQGRDWEEFKQLHAESGKILMSKSQKVKVSNWVKNYFSMPTAVNLIKNGKPEHTLFGDFMGVPTKVRADYINIDAGYIADVKTTSSPTDVDSFKYTLNAFEYDLSAALYSKMFENYYKKEFDFYFIVLGKRDNSCEVYKLSEETRKAGDHKLIEAVKVYKQCKESGIWSVSKSNESVNIEAGDYEILEV